jgi:hypothetical protein
MLLVRWEAAERAARSWLHERDVAAFCQGATVCDTSNTSVTNRYVRENYWLVKLFS